MKSSALFDGYLLTVHPPPHTIKISDKFNSSKALLILAKVVLIFYDYVKGLHGNNKTT